MQVTVSKKDRKVKPTKAIDKKQDRRIRRIEQALKSVASYSQSSVTFAGAGVGSTLGTGIVLLNGFAQGANNGERIGNDVLMKHLSMTYRLATVAGQASVAFRVMLVYYDEYTDSGVTPTTAEWLYDATNNVAMVSNKKHSEVNVKVLYDKTHVLNNNRDVGGTYPPMFSRIFKISKKLNKRVLYNENSTAGTIGAIFSGALFLVVITDTATQGTFAHAKNLSYYP